MSNLTLDLVTIRLPLDVRITEFKSDEDRMQDVNEFINEIVEKARVEVEKRSDTEGNSTLDAFGLETANIEQAVDGPPAGDPDVSDLWEDDAAVSLASSPRSSGARKHNIQYAGNEKTSWMKIANFPSTQQVIEECTVDCTPTPDLGPSILSQNESPESRPDNTSISPVLVASDGENESRTMKLIRLSKLGTIEMVAEVPSSQIEIEELPTQVQRSEPEFTLENSICPSASMFSTDMSSTVRFSTFQCNSGENTVQYNKKVKFKKSGFATQAFKAIKEQRTRSDIWKHGWRQNHNEDESDLSLQLFVRDEFVECGRCILVCENSVSNTCMVLMEAGERNQPLNTLKGQWIKLFPPYSRKFIDYCGNFVSFYYNATRCVPVNFTWEQQY